MRRVFVIVASVAMMLAAGAPAMAQAPNIQLQMQPRLQVQPKVMPKVYKPPVINKPPSMVLIKPSQALMIAQRMYPNSTGVKVKLLPGGNYAVTLKRNNNELQRVIIDGDTGVPR